MRPRRRIGNAFTLVELLLVIAIIAVLYGLGASGLGYAQQRATKMAKDHRDMLIRLETTPLLSLKDPVAKERE